MKAKYKLPKWTECIDSDYISFNEETNSLSIFVSDEWVEIEYLTSEIDELKEKLQQSRLEHQLFMSKISDIIGVERTIDLMKETHKALTK